MRNLTSSDWKRTKEAVQRITELWPGPALLPTVAEVIDGAFGSESRGAIYLRTEEGFGPAGHTWLGKASSGLEKLGDLRLLSGITQYPLTGRHQLANRPATDVEVFRGRPEALEMFRSEFLGRHGLWRQLRVALFQGDRFLGFAGVYRPRDGREFGERDLDMLSALVPSLHGVLGVARLFHGRVLDDTGIQAVIEALERPAFLTTPLGAVVLANGPARGLYPKPPAFLGSLDQLSRWAAPPASVHPIRSAGVDLRLVLPKATPEPSILSLPPSLRRVAELLAAGQSDKEIASQLELPLTTTRTYVHRAMARLGVSNRRQLMAAAKIVPKG